MRGFFYAITIGLLRLVPVDRGGYFVWLEVPSALRALGKGQGRLRGLCDTQAVLGVAQHPAKPVDRRKVIPRPDN